MTTAIITHKDFALHDTGSNHPESPDRVISIINTLKKVKSKKIEWVEAPKTNLENIYKVHSKEFVKKIEKNIPKKGIVHIDGDTVLSPKSLLSAYRAIGAGCLGVDLVVNKKIDNVFCVVRPPGHHAEPKRSMGFCLFNNVAIAAYYAASKYNLKKCAVVDFDVHHGNGTQEKFWSDKNMFYASIHQEGIFPGTGFKDETGVNDNIVNVPLPGGTNGNLFKQSYEKIIFPKLKKFSPDILFLSSGFDAHKDDPLAGFELIEEDFFWITKQLKEFADKNCKRRLVSCLEGGYNINALSMSCKEHLKGLML